VHGTTTLFSLLVADVREEFAARLALSEQNAAFFESLADRGQPVCRAILVPSWVVDVGDRAVMCLG
jgi:hypothetical protein